jgi:hypothetical protein
MRNFTLGLAIGITLSEIAVDLPAVLLYVGALAALLTFAAGLVGLRCPAQAVKAQTPPE